MSEAAQRQQSVLAGKNVLVFGGTSGIGLEAALQAKDAGAQVIVVGRTAASAKQAAARHGFAGWRAADVTDPNALQLAVQDIPTIDHLVLLAGTFVSGKVRDTNVDYLRQAFDERIWAAVHVIRALGDRLSSDGSITFISGSLADRPNAYGTAILAAASAAMEAFARGLALSLRRFASTPCHPAQSIRPFCIRHWVMLVTLSSTGSSKRFLCAASARRTKPVRVSSS